MTETTMSPRNQGHPTGSRHVPERTAPDFSSEEVWEGGMGTKKNILNHAAVFPTLDSPLQIKVTRK